MELVSGQNGFELVHEKGNWQLKKEIGFSPVELLVVSVAACGAYVYEKILTNSKIEASFEKVEIAYERNEEKMAKPVSKIVITFNLKIPEEKQEKALRSVRLIAKNCPVMQSLDPAIEVIEQVNFL